jgi:hypothetical protein
VNSWREEFVDAQAEFVEEKMAISGVPLFAPPDEEERPRRERAEAEQGTLKGCGGFQEPSG